MKLTPSQIEVLEMETRSCVACSVPRNYGSYLSVCAFLNMDWNGGLDWRGKGIEIGKRGKVWRDKGYSTAEYYDIKGKNPTWI